MATAVVEEDDYEWCLEDSVFANYRTDTDKALAKAFAEDWEMGKVGARHEMGVQTCLLGWWHTFMT